MLGYTRDEMLHMSIQSIEAQETREEIVRHTRVILERGFTGSKQMPGTEYPDHRCGSQRGICRAGTGQGHGLPRDITERNTRDHALEQAKKKLGLLNTVTFSDIQNALFTITAYNQMARGKITDEKVISILDKAAPSRRSPIP